MRNMIAALTVAAAVSFLAACGGSPSPDPVACKAAMAKAYATALSDPAAAPATEPASCYGIPAPTLSQYAMQIVKGHPR